MADVLNFLRFKKKCLILGRKLQGNLLSDVELKTMDRRRGEARRKKGLGAMQDTVAEERAEKQSWLKYVRRDGQGSIREDVEHNIWCQKWDRGPQTVNGNPDCPC